MVKALPLVADVLRRALQGACEGGAGTNAVAGAHGRHAEEFIYRVRDWGIVPWMPC